MTAHNMDHQIQKLAFSDFRPEINTKCKLFHPNTRQWILDQVKSHVDSDQPDSCIMLITAGPGMGKSTLAAKICQTYTEQGCLAGCHFFQFSNSTKNNPRLMLQSIAKQMCDTVPGYQNILESKLQRDLGKEISEMTCEELLTILFEPLCNVEQPKSNLVIVIDALDECSLDPKDELLKALKEKLSCFPSWLRFVLSSRPSTSTTALSTVAVEIQPKDQGNIKDLKVFFTFELKALYPQCDNDDDAYLIENLVEITEGLFLVAFFIIEHLKKENVASPEKVLELFPSVYENYFSRLKEVLLPYISEEEGFYNMLGAVVATKNPLPKDMFYNILGLKSEREVPHKETKTRQDALDTLHWLFPVEGNHVRAFHKSVIDWLTLKDRKHDFSVRVEDGEEVLASQCNDVVSDIRNGNKDLDKPLSFTVSETYALEFLVCLSRRKDSSASKLAVDYGLFSNAYILTALTFEFGLKKEIGDTEGMIPSFIHKMLGNVRRFGISRHWHCCPLRRPCSFGSCLTWLLQAAHEEEVSAETLTPKPLEALQKHRLPYYDKESLLPISNELSSFQRCLFKCEDGFVAVFDMRCPNSPRTAVHRFQLDGSLTGEKIFSEEKLIATSPNINFIVAIEECGRKIEILDATTLEVVRQYESPHDAIETCHVFGDDQGFFVVIKGRHDNKVYVIEGRTGRVRQTITVAEGSKVMDVSCKGHIVVSRTWASDKPEERIRFTNKHGEQMELMNWKSRNEHTYREMFLYHHDRGQKPIPIHPLAGTICQCLEHRTNDAVHFSEDGLLLVYEYKGSFFIVRTSDGSLFKRCKGGLSKRIAIVFVSRSYLVILDDDIMCVINVQTDEIEHRIPLFLPERFGMHQLCLLFPQEDGKSFNLIRCYHNPRSHSCEVSRLVFHNLNLQGLQ